MLTGCSHFINTVSATNWQGRYFGFCFGYSDHFVFLFLLQGVYATNRCSRVNIPAAQQHLWYLRSCHQRQTVSEGGGKWCFFEFVPFCPEVATIPLQVVHFTFWTECAWGFLCGAQQVAAGFLLSHFYPPVERFWLLCGLFFYLFYFFVEWIQHLFFLIGWTSRQSAFGSCTIRKSIDRNRTIWPEWTQQTIITHSLARGLCSDNTISCLEPCWRIYLWWHRCLGFGTAGVQINLFSTATAASAVVRDSYACEPGPFNLDLDLDKCQGFLLWCRLVFKQQLLSFSTDSARVNFLIGLLRGKALTWV